MNCGVKHPTMSYLRVRADSRQQRVLTSMADKFVGSNFSLQGLWVFGVHANYFATIPFRARTSSHVAIEEKEHPSLPT